MTGRKTASGPYYAAVYPAAVWKTNRAFRAVSSDAKLAYLALLTVPERVTEGLFVLPVPTLAHYLRLPGEQVEAALDELEAAGQIFTDREVDLVWLPDLLRLHTPRGEKSVKGAANKLDEVPPSPLRARFLEQCQKVCPDLAKLLTTPAHWGDFPQVGEGASDAPPDPPSDTPWQASISNSISNSDSTTTSDSCAASSSSCEQQLAYEPPEAPAPTSDDDDDLPAELIRIACGPDARRPNVKELRAVAAAIAAGYTPADLRYRADLANRASDPRAELMKILQFCKDAPKAAA